VVQVVEQLPTKCEALSSNPSATKKKKKKESRIQIGLKILLYQTYKFYMNPVVLN
jgi:hypothetical protein